MLDKLKIFLRHLWLDESDTRRAIPPELLQRLTARVAASEKRHSGEIMICVESSLPTSYLWRVESRNVAASLGAAIRERAVMMFGKLRVWDTEHNNGVLIYLLLAEHAIEIVADRGISRYVSADQWKTVVAHMAGAFREGRYEDGLTQALEEISAVLVAHFALDHTAGNDNELPDAPQLQ